MERPINQHLRLRQASAAQFAPKYVELAQRLLQHIAREGLRPGDRLGTEEELQQKHGASRFTVRHALSILAEEGYISREKARGTFVRMSLDPAKGPAVVRGTVLVACSNAQASHANEDAAFATVLRAMERTLTKKGFSVQILGLGEDSDEDRTRLQHIVGRGELEGVLAIGPCLEPYRAVVDGLPSVFTGYFYGERSYLVGDDVRVVCRESVGHLLAKGHRRIAVLCGSWIDNRAFALFAEGAREAYERAGVSFVRGNLHHAYPGEPLLRLASEILSATPRPTAVFAENWRVCEAVLGAAQQLNLRIPDDLSLVGYGQNVLHVASSVPLTAYVPDNVGAGQKSAELLAAIIDGHEPPFGPVTLPGHLVERASVREIRAGQETN